LAAYCVSEGMRNLRKTICHFYRSAGMILAVVCVLFAPPPAGFSAVLYRSYVVKYDRGWDILCDAYRVQKDDWVYKIFRQKGEISSSDFREFLSIFKRLNPHIRDIDRIRPTQDIPCRANPPVSSPFPSYRSPKFQKSSNPTPKSIGSKRETQYLNSLPVDSAALAPGHTGRD